MLVPRLVLAAALLLASLAPVTAAERMRCFTRNEQRAAIADGRAVPLASALRTMHTRVPGELVRARLCQDAGKLIYLLTVLPRDGKVRRATIDAANGTIVSER
jgi:uncharacterized membrane protein YkoI